MQGLEAKAILAGAELINFMFNYRIMDTHFNVKCKITHKLCCIALPLVQ